MKKKLLNLEQLKEIQEIIRPLSGLTRYIYGALVKKPKKDMGVEQFLYDRNFLLDKMIGKIELILTTLKKYVDKCRDE